MATGWKWRRCRQCERLRPPKGRSYCRPCANAIAQLAAHWRKEGFMLSYDKSQHWSRWWQRAEVLAA
jgi:hypothetical protein